MRRGIELGFFGREPLVYDGYEPVAVDAQMGKGKLSRFLGVNIVSPRTAHFSKIITDPKDGELAWVSWKTLERTGYKVRFFNTSGLFGYPSESYNPNTRVIEIAQNPALWPLLNEAASDAAGFLIPADTEQRTRWIANGVRTICATYNAITARFPSKRFPCNPGGLWDFFARRSDDVADAFSAWSKLDALAQYKGVCLQIANWTRSGDQWNAYNSVIVERLQMFQPGSAARKATETNSFDPADMKKERTALFIMGAARSESSRNFVGSMTAAVMDRFVGAHGDLRALVVGEEWGQLYVSNFPEVLTLFRKGGINFIGVFQNAAAQIEARYGKETGRLWKKAAAHTLYRGLPDEATLREIEYLSGKTSVMMRGFNVSNAQVNGSGDNMVEQARPLLQVEDVRAITGGERALLHSRDLGFFVVDTPNYWERPELNGMLRDVRMQPDPYARLLKYPMLEHASPAIDLFPETMEDPDDEIAAAIARLDADERRRHGRKQGRSKSAPLKLGPDAGTRKRKGRNSLF